ncbi:alpha/beta fold hydrolase [Arsenicicoccus bolidensis]|uniref:alpha/beta fold hydrolase n=1 Tax=Arsenicicoccus bolidensis TaxID=229480 RepID=UPI0028A71CA5|nr:alpha/beta hydrolase [Arsenicicoccus bolidensis]
MQPRRSSELTARTRQLDGVGGVRIAVDEWGSPDDPLVLFLHGGGQTRHSWKSAGADLAAAGLHTVSADLRGHGDSDWAPDADYGLEAIRDDVICVLDQIGGPAALVGASMGGLTSLLVAHERPELVSRLVLVDVVPRIERAGAVRITGFMRSAPHGFADLDEAADAIAAYLPHRTRPRSTDGLRKNLRQGEDGRWYWHWDPAMFTTDSHPDPERIQEQLETAARELTMPTLLLQGALSDVVSDDGVEHFRGLAPSAQVVRLQDAAHTAAADDNDAFTHAVRDFLLPG